MGLIKNIIWNNIGNGLTILFGFLFQLLILRYFYVDDVAAYFLTISLGYLSLLPTNFFLNVMIRYIPYYTGKGNSKKLSSILSLTSIYLVFVTFILVFLIIALQKIIIYYFPLLKSKILLASVFVFLLNLHSFIRTIFGSFDRFKEFSIMNITLSFLKILFVSLAFFFSLNDYTGIMYSFISSLILSSLYGIYKTRDIVKKYDIKLVFELDKEEVINMAKYSVSTFIDNARASVLGWIDLLFLGYFSIPKSVSGYGGTANFSKTINNFIVGSFFHPLLVGMSKKEGEKKSSLSLFKTSLNYLNLMSSFLAGLIFVSSKEIIEILIPKYSEYYIIMQIFSLNLLIYSISSLCRITLMSKRWLKPLLYASFTIITINIILNFILIKEYDALGAAISSLIALTVEMFFFIHLFQKNFNMKFGGVIFKHYTLFLLMIIPSLLIETIENVFMSLILKLFVSSLIGIIFIYLFEKESIKTIYALLNQTIKKDNILN